MKIEFDKFPGDISFTVRDEGGGIVWLQDFRDYSATDGMSSFGQCVPAEGALHFEINDAHSDGICCNTESTFFLSDGSRGYEVYLGDKLVGKRVFPFGSHQEMLFQAAEDSSLVEVYQPDVWCED